MVEEAVEKESSVLSNSFALCLASYALNANQAGQNLRFRAVGWYELLAH
jgi:hypothetical protein